jgi:hypothetical protein
MYRALWRAEVPPGSPADFVLVGWDGQRVLAQVKYQLKEDPSPRPRDMSGIGKWHAALGAFLAELTPPL